MPLPSLLPVTALWTGTPGADVIDATAEVLAGENYDGGSGIDTLHLIGGGRFDLRLPKLFTGIEIIQGSEAHDTIVLSAERLTGLTAIHSGPGPLLALDVVELWGGGLDLSGIAVTGIDRIDVMSDGAQITFADADTALLAWGTSSQRDKLVATSVTFSMGEIQTLHRQGIDTVVDAGGIHANLAPVTTNLDGDRFEAKAGERVFVDRNRDAMLTEDDGRLALLTVQAPVGLSAPGRLGIDLGGDIALSGGYAPGSTVLVDGLDIGMVWEASDATLSVIFNASATPARVQEILRALTYTMADAVPQASIQQQIAVTLADEGGRRSTSMVRIDQRVALEQPQLTLSHAAVPEGSPGGTLVGLLSTNSLGSGGFSYELLDSAAGRFRLEGDRLLVAPGSSLDFERYATHSVKVQAKAFDGALIEQTFSILIEDVRDEVIHAPGGSAVGTAGNDTLVGGRGRDRLLGKDGDDVLYGKGGHDMLTGGAGKDVFMFDTKPQQRTNIDRIIDFRPKDDAIQLDNAVFKKLGKGSSTIQKALKKSFFTIGDEAKDASDHLIYKRKTGELFYDADGSGPGAQVKIAGLTKKPSLSVKDFFVI